VPASAAAPSAIAHDARLESVTITDFRNIAHAELRLGASGIVVLGENGQGKSNLLEAIAYLRILRSARGARDKDLIRFGQAAFHLGAELRGTTARRAGVGVDRQGRKRATLDGAEVTRLSDALDALPSVSFAPRDVDLVAGSPAERRRYLDITLALTSRSYLNALRLYRAALLRRNAALRDAAKGGRGAAAAVGAWEPALAEHGAVLVEQRRAWVRDRAADYARLCDAIGEDGTSAMAYAGATTPRAASGDGSRADHPEPSPREALLAALERQRDHDIRRCLTHTGPHRDDLTLTLEGRDLRVVGSAGQQRSAAIVLRLLEAATHRDATGVTPVLLLDDPFAELDRRRTARILDLLGTIDDGQCILAVPREDEIPARFTRLERWRVRAGAFAPVEAA
jgi:DNA replication and repair protein RecF